MGSVVI